MNEFNKPKNNNKTFKIPRSLILTGKALQFVSTGLAARFMGKIFATPPRYKIPEREHMMEKSAKTETVRIDSIQKDIRIFTYGYSKKKVLLAHGWSGRGTQMYQIADKLLENRMMVISLDAPAHGASSGKQTNMPEYVKTLKFINDRYGPFYAAIGHSWGGMNLLMAVAEGLPLEKLVIIGADDRISEVLGSFVKKFELKPAVSVKIKQRYDKILQLDIDSFSSTVTAEKVSIPTLVVHDTSDKFVPVSSAYKIRQKLKHGVLLISNGLGHHKIFKDAGIIQRIIDFLK